MSWLEISNKLIAITISCLILYNGYLVKRRTGSWFVLGSLICVFWFCFTFFPLVLLYRVPVNNFSILYIAFGVFIFSWSHVFFDWKKVKKLKKQKFWLEKTNKSQWLFLIMFFVILSLVFSITFLYFQENNILEYFTKPVQSAESLAKRRYSKTLVKTNYNAISFVFSNVSVLLGGVIYGVTKNKLYRLLVFLCFIPSLFTLVTQSAKGLFFLSLFIFFGSLIISNNNKNILLFFKKNFKKLIVAFLFIPLLLVYSFLSRGLNYNSGLADTISKLKFLFSSYILAHIYSFSDWFTAYTGGIATREYDISNNYYGFYTFNFITRHITDENRNVRGIYKEYFYYDDIIQTNVYTIFRGLIMDFNIFGSYLFIFFVGLLSHKLYHIYSYNKNNVFTFVVIIFLFSCFYMSFLSSLLYWTVIPLSFLLFYFILITLKYVCEGKTVAK